MENKYKLNTIMTVTYTYNIIIIIYGHNKTKMYF